MNIILFGPPGVGKSTLIGALKSHGARAIDLEDLYPNRIRFQVPNCTDGTFIGAADLSPQRKYSNAKKVLLYMGQDAYRARRKARDTRQPGKAAQQEHLIDNWLENTSYDEIIDVSGSVEDTVLKVLALQRRWNHGNN